MHYLQLNNQNQEKINFLGQETLRAFSEANNIYPYIEKLAREPENPNEEDGEDVVTAGTKEQQEEFIAKLQVLIDSNGDQKYTTPQAKSRLLACIRLTFTAGRANQKAALEKIAKLEALDPTEAIGKSEELAKQTTNADHKLAIELKLREIQLGVNAMSLSSKTFLYQISSIYKSTVVEVVRDCGTGCSKQKNALKQHNQKTQK